MNSGLHLAAGWLVAEGLGLEYADRRIVAFAGVASDLDGLAILGGTQAFRTYHHFLLHNLLAVCAIVLLVGLIRRRRRVVLAAAVAALLHLACDFVASDWSLYLFEPFWDCRVNMTAFLPRWAVVYLLQGAATVAIFALVALVASTRERTFLEVFTPKGDRLVVRFFLLWLKGARCACGRSARFKCRLCGKPLCHRHIHILRRPLRILCQQCTKNGKDSAGATA